MKTIITYGTFDLLHVGHVRLLQRAKSYGDRLIVGVSTDEFNLEKGKRSIFGFSERAEIVSSIKFVDQVFPENNWNQKNDDIKKYGADILIMGEDWEGKFDELKSVVNVIYIPRTPDISTTYVKRALSGVSRESLEAIKEAADLILNIIRVGQ